MRLFSHRKRAAAAGPLPTELLPRLAPGTLDARKELPDPPPASASPGEWGVAHVFGDIVDVFTACRTADVLAAPAPMPSAQAAVDNMRGYCFFLDADLAGICEPSRECWTAEPIEGHRSAIAIVGTRRRTTYGRTVATKLAGDLASAGLTIVSGLARGIDGHAHRAALQHGGRTLAVLGHGLDTIYPAEHRSLAAEVAAQGALLSEYPIGVGPAAEHFPIRNRIISGLALATVVVEAGEASGALITARAAADEGRDVFAVPGPITSPASRGCHQLIQEGAGLVNEAQDILDALNLHLVPAARQLAMAMPANDEEAQVLAALQRTPGAPCHIDDIIRDAQLPAHTVGSTLTVLTLKGLAQELGNQHYASLS